MTELKLRATEPADLDYVLAAEHAPEARSWVTPRSRETHLAALGDPDVRHFVVERDGLRVGFVFLAGVADTNGSVELRRIVMTERGDGLGTRTMHMLVDLVFDELGAHRLWLDVVEENDRARRLYQRLGFVEEGRMREAFRTDAGFKSLVLMSMLEHERPA